MKVAVIYALAFGMSIMIFSQAEAGEKKICRYTASDIGTIVGKGANFPQAYEDAATQCFERQAERYRKKHKAELDEDHGIAIIDVCANITCS